MKCYNCNQVFESLPKACPKCKHKVDEKEYRLKDTSEILKSISSIKDFAHFIGLFYVKAPIFLVIAIVAMIVGILGWRFLDSREMYMVFAFAAIIAFNFFLEMKKVENFYKDYQLGENKYIILYTFNSEGRSFVSDAMDKVINDSDILKQRNHAYENTDKSQRFLRFKTFGMYHPQKPKLFMKKDKFYTKFFNPDARHFIKTGNYDDESFVLYQGALHGFLISKNGIITVFNTPKLTKEFFGEQEDLVKQN